MTALKSLLFLILAAGLGAALHSLRSSATEVHKSRQASSPTWPFPSGSSAA